MRVYCDDEVDVQPVEKPYGVSKQVGHGRFVREALRVRELVGVVDHYDRPKSFAADGVHGVSEVRLSARGVGSEFMPLAAFGQGELVADLGNGHTTFAAAGVSDLRSLFNSSRAAKGAQRLADGLVGEPPVLAAQPFEEMTGERAFRRELVAGDACVEHEDLVAVADLRDVSDHGHDHRGLA